MEITLTLNEARTLASVKLYKALDPLNERAMRGEYVSQEEKGKALNILTAETTRLVEGVSTEEIVALAREWMQYFTKNHHPDFVKRNMPIMDGVMVKLDNYRKYLISLH